MPTSKAECPECGAKPGKPCLSMRGKTVGQPIKGGKLHAKRVMSDVDVPQEQLVYETAKEARIEQILFAIKFARDQGYDQARIDRRLAEMWAEDELDLKLF